MPNFENEKKPQSQCLYPVDHWGNPGIVFYCFWAPPVAPPPPDEEGMEVNLGDSETGEGDVQPLIPGEPSAETEETVSTPHNQRLFKQLKRKLKPTTKTRKHHPSLPISQRINPRISPSSNRHQHQQNPLQHPKKKPNQWKHHRPQNQNMFTKVPPMVKVETMLQCCNKAVVKA